MLSLHLRRLIATTVHRAGFGRALATTVLQRGDKVIATARSKTFIKLEPLKALGAATLELDVGASPDALADIAKNAVAIYGKVDVVVNNAGYLLLGVLEENTEEEIQQQFQFVIVPAQSSLSMPVSELQLERTFLVASMSLEHSYPTCARGRLVLFSG